MEKYLQKFFENHIDLIEQNAWNIFYLKAHEELVSDSVGRITELLFQANINPLDYLDYIPSDFLSGTAIKTFEVPEGIKTIKSDAFEACLNLKSIYLPTTLKVVETRAFKLTVSLTDIYYEGTVEQWDEVNLKNGWQDLVHIDITVHCKDRNIYYDKDAFDLRW